MKIYVKVAIAFFLLLFGAVTLIDFFSFPKKLKPFLLINQVEETDLAFHADINKIFNEFDIYSQNNEIPLGQRVIASQVKQQLTKSGLALKESYLTYSLHGSKIVSFYIAIQDTALFKKTFMRWSKHLELKPSTQYSNFYCSQTKDLSLEKHEKYIKINWGKGAVKKTPNKRTIASPLFLELLEKKDEGVLNTTGTNQLDPKDYISFKYEYERDFSLIINWNVLKNHPLQMGKQSIPIYPSQKNEVQAYSNIDLKKIQQYTNVFLKEKANEFKGKLPLSIQEVFNLWNGEASFHMGGKIAEETVQFITEFDDDFNPIERKVVKIDSIPDLGIYLGSSHPQKSFDVLLKLPNVKTHKNQLQLALLPSLNVKQGSDFLKLATSNVDFIDKKNKYIISIISENQLMKGKLTVQKVTDKVVQFQLTVKTPSVPEKLTLSHFW